MPLSLWTPLEDVFSSDPNISAGISTTNAPNGFFIAAIPTNSGVQIFSPTNGETISGTIAVGVGAQIGTQIQGVNLYLDDALVGFIDSGGILFSLDTTHFTNGLHTLYVGAVDTANNETLSSSITLDFENPVRWLDASSMFNYDVPIDVTSDFFPADWLVTVTDTNGTIVRTISGSTTDGNINTNWDGTDNNGQSLSVESLYQITVDVTETGDGFSMMSSSVASTLGATSVSSKLNSYGVPEFTAQKPAPNPLTAYLQILNIYNQLTPEEKLIYPPLPEQPANNPYATTIETMSAREMFLAIHQSSNISSSMAAGTVTPNDSGMRSGSTKTLVWWENQWGSRQTIVARVPIAGSLNTDVINLCNQIADFLGLVDDLNRQMFGGNVELIQNSADLTQLKSDLDNQNVSALYFYCHGNTNGNAFGIEDAVISGKDLAALFGNSYISSLPASYGSFAGKPMTHKPFNFVFLDGCNTALGDLPEAFGISKTVSGDALNEANLSQTCFHGLERAGGIPL